MILRMASIALALMLVAAPTHAQEDRRQGGGQGQPAQGGGKEDPFDIFNPTSLRDGDTPPPTDSQGGVYDAAAGRTNTGQTRPQGGTTPVVDDDAEPADAQAELEWANEQERVVTPPDDIKAQIDAAIAADIAAHAQSTGQQIGDLQQRTERGDAQGATRAAHEFIRGSDAEFPDLSDVPEVVSSARGEMEDVAASMSGESTSEVGPDGRPASGVRTRTPRRDPSVPYEDPFRDDYFGSNSSTTDPYGMYAENEFEPIHYPARGTPDSRMSWWQQLLIKSLQGVSEGLKGLTERRANELKARNERIRRNYPEYRAYVDYESRRAIERSAFARSGNNSSLDGLILGPARTNTGTTSTTGGNTTPVRDVSSLAATNRTARVITRVPRVNDPVTGEEKLIIDMPLGVDASRPIR